MCSDGACPEGEDCVGTYSAVVPGDVQVCRPSYSHLLSCPGDQFPFSVFETDAQVGVGERVAYQNRHSGSLSIDLAI